MQLKSRGDINTAKTKLQLDTDLNTIQIIGKVDQLYSSFECILLLLFDIDSGILQREIVHRLPVPLPPNRTQLTGALMHACGWSTSLA